MIEIDDSSTDESMSSFKTADIIPTSDIDITIEDTMINDKKHPDNPVPPRVVEATLKSLVEDRNEFCRIPNCFG